MVCVQASTAGGPVSPEDLSNAEDGIEELQESPWRNSGIELPLEESGSVSFQRLGQSISAVRMSPPRRRCAAQPRSRSCKVQMTRFMRVLHLELMTERLT